MNLSILDGRAELWQWDTGIRLVMDEACEAVNISASTFGVSVDVTAAEDGKTWVAAVPDEMLQVPGDLICYAVQTTGTGTITAAYRSFRVNRRPKPYGYVATPTEARTWQELDDKKIDAPQVAQAGEVLTVEEVDEDGKPKKWKTAPGVRGEKGDTGPAGPQGADGKDGAGIDVTGEVGDGVVLKSVDADGKPVEWESAKLAKADGSNLSTTEAGEFRTRIVALPGQKIYCKESNGKILAYTDKDCTQEATSPTALVLVEYGNSLLIYGNKTYQCTGFEAPASVQGAPAVADYFRAELTSSGAVKIEIAKFNPLDYLAGTITSPVTITEVILASEAQV